MNNPWIPGQRVLNEAESSLGLGIVRRILDHRNIEIVYRASSLTHVYNVRTAPLRRVILKKGHPASTREGHRFRVARVLRAKDGLIVYEGEDGRRVREQDLADELPSSGVMDQLLTGTFSAPGDYELRMEGWRLRQAILSQETRGLASARVRLLGHQLYVAHKVSRQEIPRVLLADEVGLGKTIEAGLIFCALRSLGRAGRVLILTPESLVHQWLAEMMRRFNEMFVLLDEERCLDLDETEVGGVNPFEAAGRAITNIAFLSSSPQRLRQACKVRWDLVIVDEAHHLEWSEAGESSFYRTARVLGERSRGLLLLTATPMRRGPVSEFGLLRLVDPERFGDLKAFMREQQQMKHVADLASELWPPSDDLEPVAPVDLSPEKRQDLALRLGALFPEDRGLQNTLAQFAAGGDATRVLDALLDRHGTGRVLIRNRRDRLHGFPERRLHAVGLHAAEGGRAVRDEDAADPRLAWLLGFVRTMRDEGEKVLLITRTPQAVTALQDFFRDHSNVRAAIFHERMSVVERDRQAAWFAEPDGADILMCSEIGGEGRNFQFAHHLVLYDIPEDPDLLEQRIGRLDRIGQDRPVDIHALYTIDTPTEALFRWHRDGLGAFDKPVSGAEQVVEALGDELTNVLEAWEPDHPAFGRRHRLLDDLLNRTKTTLEEVRREIQRSIDILIDLNSYDASQGRRLVGEIGAVDADASLEEYMTRTLDRFGVQEEDVDTGGRKRIRPGDLMFVDSFPGLPPGEDGIGATYRRDLALTREDLDFLSREHPLAEGALGMVIDQNLGRATVASWPGAPERGALLIFLFLLEARGTLKLELNRYLPITPVEIFVDHRGQEREDLRELLGSGAGGDPSLRPKLERVTREDGLRATAALAGRLQELSEEAARRAEERLAERRSRALEQAREQLEDEQDRLEELSRVNPNISQAEIEAHQRKVKLTLEALGNAEIRLDAVKLILMS